jgi:hypothetical protein
LPYDLTGCSARGQIRKSYMSTNAINFVATVDANPLSGVVHLQLASHQTAAMKAGRYVYDVEIYKNYIEEGALVTMVMRIAEGQFEVSPAVTHNQTVSSAQAPTDLSVIWYDPTDDSYAYYDTNSQAWIKYN